VQCKKPADELKFSTRSRKRIRIEIATTKTKAEQRIAKSKKVYLYQREREECNDRAAISVAQNDCILIGCAQMAKLKCSFFEHSN